MPVRGINEPMWKKFMYIVARTLVGGYPAGVFSMYPRVYVKIGKWIL